jgi:hypothetical protein
MGPTDSDGALMPSDSDVQGALSRDCPTCGAHAGFSLPPYPLGVLVGELPDAPGDRTRRLVGGWGPAMTEDRYRSISPPEYFRVLAGIEVGPSGLVSCPNPGHIDEHPSCRVWPDPGRGFYCFACGAGGGVYDLASLLDGGPYGPGLRGEAFSRARQRVRTVFASR